MPSGYLCSHLNNVPNSSFSFDSAECVECGMKTQSNSRTYKVLLLLSGLPKVEFNFILNPVLPVLKTGHCTKILNADRCESGEMREDICNTV